MKNNKGFSLVELVISVGILGILSVAVLGFLYSGASSYSSIYSSLGLQSESQLALSQVSERVMECSGSIDFDETADGALLTLISPDGEGETEHAFRFDREEDILYYRVRSDGEAGDWEPVSAHVTDFRFSRDRSAVTITLSFDRRGKTYTGSQVVSLRNSPAFGKEAAA